jgi:hypothetical protein
MAKIFNKLTFKKLPYGKIVSSNGTVSFRKLAEEVPFVPPPPVLAITPDNFDLGIIGLKKGTYILTATTEAPELGLAMSDHSLPITYTVE